MLIPEPPFCLLIRWDYNNLCILLFALTYTHHYPAQKKFIYWYSLKKNRPLFVFIGDNLFKKVVQILKQKSMTLLQKEESCTGESRWDIKRSILGVQQFDGRRTDSLTNLAHIRSWRIDRSGDGYDVRTRRDSRPSDCRLNDDRTTQNFYFNDGRMRILVRSRSSARLSFPTKW